MLTKEELIKLGDELQKNRTEIDIYHKNVNDPNPYIQVKLWDALTSKKHTTRLLSVIIYDDIYQHIEIDKDGNFYTWDNSNHQYTQCAEPNNFEYVMDLLEEAVNDTNNFYLRAQR